MNLFAVPPEPAVFLIFRFFVRSRDPHPAIHFTLILPMDSRLMALSRARVDAAQTDRLPEFLKPTRQPVADALGVVVGVVVVLRGGHGGSSPEFVEHELLLGRVERRARNGVPSGVDVLPCPALCYEGGEFHACLGAFDLRKAGERFVWACW